MTLAGHSPGASVVCLYVGVRPERVQRVVDLEDFGMPTSKTSRTPRRYTRWPDGLKDKPRLSTYATVGDAVVCLQETNPRLPADEATFLTQHWSS